MGWWTDFGEGRWCHHKVSSLVPSRFVIGNRALASERTDAMGRVRLPSSTRSERRLAWVRGERRSPRTLTLTIGVASLGKRYEHFAVLVGDPEVAEDADDPRRLRQSAGPSGIRHGGSAIASLQAYLNETFRFNRRFYPWCLPLPPRPSLAMSAHRPSMNSIQGNGSTLHVVGDRVNRIRQGSWRIFPSTSCRD